MQTKWKNVDKVISEVEKSNRACFTPSPLYGKKNKADKRKTINYSQRQKNISLRHKYALVLNAFILHVTI